jgi:two-component system, NtrC family, sensor kinase
MKSTSLVLFFSLIVISVFPQNMHYVDSLKKALSQSEEDTNKVKLYANLSWEYQWSYPDSALSYSLPGLQLAKKLHFEEGEFDNLTSLGMSLTLKGDYSKALETQLKARDIAERLNNHEKVEDNLWFIGGVYQYSGDYQKALYYFNKTSRKNILSEDSKILIGMIGQCYFYLNNLDSAMFYIKKVYDFDVRSSSHWSPVYYYMAAINDKKGISLPALDYYREGIKLSLNRADSIEGYNRLASLFKKIGMEDSAIFYSKKVIAEGLKASFPSDVHDASKLLAGIYKSKHFTDSAFKYLELMLVAKDSFYSEEKLKQLQNLSFNEQLRQQEIQQTEVQYKNKVKIYILLGGIAVLLLLAGILYRNNKQKQKANIKIEKAYEELKSTQAQLVQSEKMASLGELTAGIAHEIQNPLNFVNNFSEVNTELIDELKTELATGNQQQAIELADNIKDNEQKINHHGKRADAIVKGMLQHSRSSSGVKEPTDINKLADEYLRLAYHGLRAKDKTFNAAMKTDFDESIGKINIIPQDIGRVILNLITNAFYAAPLPPKGGFKDPNYKHEPTVWVKTSKNLPSGGRGAEVLISVRDNGPGIPQNVLDKIFQPFFTTKPSGEGMGLGLSLSYDIIKAHGGELKVETKEGEGSEFIILLPL